MNKIIYYSILLEMIFCLGIKSLYIPQNAILVGTSSTGLAISPELNPANICLNKSFFSFSNNDWLANVKGQKISMLFQSNQFFDNSYMSMETLNSKNIEIRDNTPTDDPLGYFGAYWYAFEFAQSKNLNNYFRDKNFSIGYKMKLNLSKLYFSKMYGYTIDVGLTKKINKKINFALVIKNMGKQFSDDLYADDNKLYAFGVNYIMKKIKISSDIYYENDGINMKYALETMFNYFNLFFGSSNADSYDSFSYGFSINAGNWSLLYGALENKNSTFENPISIELRKYF